MEPWRVREAAKWRTKPGAAGLPAQRVHGFAPGSPAGPPPGGGSPAARQASDSDPPPKTPERLKGIVTLENTKGSLFGEDHFGKPLFGS